MEKRNLSPEEINQVEKIVIRKQTGQDCTEEESVLIKAFFRNEKNSSGFYGLVSNNFPIECAEIEEELEREIVIQEKQDEFLKEKAQLLEKAIGMCVNPREAEALAKVVARMLHRTNQQSLTRFFIAWMGVASENDFGTDARNEDSHRLAQKVHKHIRDNDLTFLSYI